MMKHIATFAGIAGGNASHRDIIEVNDTGLALEHTTANFCFYKRCTALTGRISTAVTFNYIQLMHPIRQISFLIPAWTPCHLEC